MRFSWLNMRRHDPRRARRVGGHDPGRGAGLSSQRRGLLLQQRPARDDARQRQRGRVRLVAPAVGGAGGRVDRARRHPEHRRPAPHRRAHPQPGDCDGRSGDDQAAQAYAHMISCLYYVGHGDWPSAERSAKRCQELCEPMDDRVNWTNAQAVRFWMSHYRSHDAAALDAARHLRDRASETGNRQHRAWALRCLALCALRRDEPPEAVGAPAGGARVPRRNRGPQRTHSDAGDSRAGAAAKRRRLVGAGDGEGRAGASRHT